MSDHYSLDLFDPWDHLGAKRRRMLEDSWAGLFRREVLLSLPIGPVAACFSGTMGRPCKDLRIAVGVLVLQELHDLTDEQAARALAFDLAWQYALDCRGEGDMLISERTIRNYRGLVLEHGLDQVLFRQVTDHLIDAFDVDTRHQRIDSTVLRSRMRHLGRLGTFTETLEQFLRELGKAHPVLHQQLDPTLLERYADGGKALCFGLAGKPSQAAAHLEQAAADVLLLVRRFAGTEAEQLPGYGLLRRVLEEQCQVQAGEGTEKAAVIEAKSVSGSSLQNPSDPDATYNGHKGQGFMMQVMESYRPEEPVADAPAKPDLITHVSVNTMVQSDSAAVEPAIADTAQRGIAPEDLLGDTTYGVGDNPQKAKQAGVELISPAQPPAGYKQEKLSLEDFVLDEAGIVLTCPAGHKPISTSATEKNYQARFDRCTCETCPLRPLCPVQKPRETDPSAMRVQYDQPRLEMRRRRKLEEQQEFVERYRWRAGIEATMSRLKHQVGLGWLRVRGLVAIQYKAFMRALGLNILRCAAAA